MEVRRFGWEIAIYYSIILLLQFSDAAAQEAFAPTYKFSKEIDSKFSSDTTIETTAWHLSFIGEYAQMLEVWDRKENKWPKPDQAQIDGFRKYKPVNAHLFLAEKARSEQIIIINEAHQQPYHRMFTTSILQILYDQGFRYFGAETLWYLDTLINKRKYPIMESGIYTQEPCYGNLVREALRIGFKVFAYESTRRDDDSAGINMREVTQARNIKKMLDADPHAKILIHCGFGHITETPVYSWGKAMAGRLKEYTGIDPYTIDQIRFTEHSTPEYDNPLFKLVNLDDYAVFVDSTGQAFNGTPRHKDYDARIYHPRTRWMDGRPHWVFEGGRKPYYIRNTKISYPCLVFAYLDNEASDVKDPMNRAIPYDVIELNIKTERKALSLKKGRYIIIVQSIDGKQRWYRKRIR